MDLIPPCYFNFAQIWKYAKGKIVQIFFIRFEHLFYWPLLERMSKEIAQTQFNNFPLKKIFPTKLYPTQIFSLTKLCPHIEYLYFQGMDFSQERGWKHSSRRSSELSGLWWWKWVCFLLLSDKFLLKLGDGGTFLAVLVTESSSFMKNSVILWLSFGICVWLDKSLTSLIN